MADRVTLVAPRPDEWSRRAAVVAAQIAHALPSARIEHIGSTAVTDLISKDVVDLIVGVAAVDVDTATDALAAQGFDVEGRRPGHTWSCVPERSARSAVVHVVTLDGGEWCRRIAFRDLLRRDPQVRAEYAALKREVVGDGPGWAEYTRRKAAFVAAATERALAGLSRGA